MSIFWPFVGGTWRERLKAAALFVFLLTLALAFYEIAWAISIYF